MKAQAVFISSILVLSLFNFIYVSSTPEKINNMSLGAITGSMVLIISIAVIGGFTLFGSGLSSASVKIIFGVGALLNILFKIDISGFPIGLGLMNNIFEVFTCGDLLGLGLFIATIFSIITLVSGLIIIIGGAGGE